MNKLAKVAIICSITLLVCWLILMWLPSVSFEGEYSTVLLDKNDELLSASIAADGQWRFPPQNHIPEKYETAVLTFEDKRFYYHFGIDPLAIGRAFVSNVRAGKVVSGASTVTMQVIRLSRKGKPRTISEKVVEAFYAIILEVKKSKKEILSLYAAHAPFGGNVVGLEAASWRYFGCDPERLTWAESAMLAVLPNDPALIHPGRNRGKLLIKRNALLQRMFERGIFDSLTCELAKAESLPPAPHPIPMHALHLLEQMKKNALPGSISRYITTIDKQMQIQVNRIVTRHEQMNRENHVYNAAALIIDVHTGKILVYAGNLTDRNTDEHGYYVDIITAPRSTGSLLKPILYAGMLQSGELLPSQLVPDLPTRMGGFAPQNYTRTYQGAVPAWQVLARSLNVPAVRMLRSYGVDRFYHLLQNLGMTTLHRKAEDYGLSLILGGAEGTLWDLTSIFARMAFKLQTESDLPEDEKFRVRFLENDNGGFKVGSADYPLDAGTIWLVFKAMLEVARPGSENPWRRFLSSRKVAWKTGTSYGHRDAWAIGVTPDIAVGVWVGNADGEGRPGLTGLQAAAPILFDIFNISGNSSWFSMPEMNLEKVVICSRSGFRKGLYCRQSKTIWSIPDKNTPVCPYCKLVHLDNNNQWQVTTKCESFDNIITQSWFVLPAAMEWYYRQHHVDYQPLPPFKAGCQQEKNLPLALIYPQKNSEIYIPRELDGQLGRTVFEATHRNPAMKLFWHLDSEFIGETKDIHQIAVAPQPGTHQLTIIDENGNFQECRFVIVNRN